MSTQILPPKTWIAFTEEKEGSELLGQITAQQADTYLVRSATKEHSIPQAQLRELSPEELASYPLIDRLRIAFITQDDSFLGQLVRTGEAVVIERSAYTTMHKELKAITQFLQKISQVIEPVLQQPDLVTLAKSMKNNPMSFIMGDLTKAVAGKSKVLNLWKLLNLQPLKEQTLEDEEITTLLSYLHKHQLLSEASIENLAQMKQQIS